MPLLSFKDLPWTPLGKADLLTNEHPDSESNNILKNFLLVAVPMESTITIIARIYHFL
jgi:hypothetical protein